MLLCMRQGMLTLSGAPSTTSLRILSSVRIWIITTCPYLIIWEVLFNNYHALIFDLMSSRNMYLYNAYIYTYILLFSTSVSLRKCFKKESE